MAKLKIFNNIFEDTYKEVEYDPSKSLQEQIECYIDIERYTKDLVECYDPDEDRTYYAPIEDDVGTPSVALLVNGRSVDFSYEPMGSEVVNVIYMPTKWDWGKFGSAFVGFCTGALSGAVIGAPAGVAGVVIGALVGGTIGAVGGIHLHNAIVKSSESTTETEEDSAKDVVSYSAKEKAELPDIRGANNQSLLGNSFPFVMGKHLATPFLVGDPYTTYSGENGKNATIRACYCVGYAPLKLTDFKLGDFYLAHNQDFGTSHPTYLNGVLKGYSTSQTDDGDIVDYWKNNNVSLEIMQWDGTSALNYGHIYPNKVVDKEIDANILYVADSDIQEAINYKGTTLPNKFRTNSVYFTESCPKKFTVVLEAENDIYATWTKTTETDSSSTSKVEYGSIPLWYAVQWRPYSKNNQSSDSNGEDYNDWNNITTFKNAAGTGTVNYGATYDQTAFENDVKAHKGNSFDNSLYPTEADLWEKIRQGIESVGNYARRVYNDQTTVLNKIYPAVNAIPSFYTGLSSSLKAKHTSPLDTNYSNFTSKGGFRLFADKPNSFIGKSTSNFKVNIGYLSDSNSVGTTFGSGRVFVKETGTVSNKKNVLYLNIQSNASDFSSPNSFINTTIGEDFVYTDVNLTLTLYNYGEANESNCFTNSTFVDRKIAGSSSVHIDKIAIFGKTVYNNFRVVPKLANNWFDRTLCNFQSASGSAETASTLTTKRFVAEVDVSAYANKIIASDNSINGIEVRVIRVSPCYCNQTVSNSSSSDDVKISAYTYSDSIKFKTLQTEVFDKQIYQNSNTVTGVKIASEEDIKKFCYIAIEATADKAGYISTQLEKLNCVAESFSPIYDSTQKKWIPENVTRQTAYYGYYKMVDSVKTACNRKDSSICESITQAQYEAGIQQGFDWIRERTGTDFLTKIRSEIFNTASTHNSYACNTLKTGGEKYNNNNSASIFMLACVGAQNKRAALGYEQINLIEMADWYESIENLTDGSTYKVDTVSNGVQYLAGDLVHFRCCCNGYVYKGQKLETLLSKIAITGRATYTYDDCGKIKVVFDKKNDYPVGVISSENCLNGSTNTYVYEDSPAGLLFNFFDENDGYDTNSIYCFADGFDRESYKGDVESYSIDYVTDPTQLWSLGRYILACRLQTREVLTRKVGLEGHTFGLGDVVLVQDDELLIGGGSGRIQEVIEDDNLIYGYVSDSLFEDIKDIDDDDEAQSATTILQPSKYGEARCVTLDIKLDTVTLSQTVSGETVVRTFKAEEKGNVVLFKNPIAKSTNKLYSFKTGDICMVGDVNKVSGKYRITKIKPEKNGTFTETLVPYSDSLYNYGKEMPSFDNYMTQPPVMVDPVTLSDALNIGLLETKLADTSTTTMQYIKTVCKYGKPDAPTNVSAIASKLVINLKWDSKETSSTGLKNAISYYIYQISTDNGETWGTEYKTSEASAEYAIGYLEATTMATYKVRVAAINISNETSNYTVVSVNTDTYGTWIIPALSSSNVTKEENDRTVTLKLAASTPSRTLYGNTQFRISIKRTGFVKAQSTDPDSDYSDISFVADTSWYKPDLYSSPYDSETAYKTSTVDGYETVTSRFSQTLPLAGQSSNKIVNTTYSYKIVATNESGYTTSPLEVSATALCTSIRDVVKAKANYKELYIEKLSAIVANVGMINQGGFGDFANWQNFWALSDMTATEAGSTSDVVRGTFRVGDDNEYIKVTPVDEDGNPVTSYSDLDHYSIEMKAGDISLTTEGMSLGETGLAGGTFVYKSGNRNERLAFSSNGFVIQKKVNGEWTETGKVYEDSNQSMIINNGLDISYGIKVTGSKCYHFESYVDRTTTSGTVRDFAIDEDGVNSKNIVLSELGSLVDDVTVPISKDKTRAFSGTVTKDMTDETTMILVTNADFIVNKEVIVKSNGTTIDDAKDINDIASTSWGLTSTQVTNRLFRY